MNEPRPGTPDGAPDAKAFDRTAQAARFLDLARRHSILASEQDDPPAAPPTADPAGEDPVVGPSD